MLAKILSLIGSIFGIKSGATVGNMVGGVVNNAVSLSLVSYLIIHADQEIHFSTSLGFLALVVAFAYLLIEVVRRTSPGAG